MILSVVYSGSCFYWYYVLEKVIDIKSTCRSYVINNCKKWKEEKKDG